MTHASDFIATHEDFDSSLIKEEEDKKKAREIFNAASIGDIGELLKLLRAVEKEETRGNLLNGYTSQGYNALLKATYHGHANCVKVCLEHGSKYNFVEILTGNTAIHIACSEGKPNCLYILLSHEMSLNLPPSELCFAKKNRDGKEPQLLAKLYPWNNMASLKSFDKFRSPTRAIILLLCNTFKPKTTSEPLWEVIESIQDETHRFD